jgi:hypothetical protein
MNVYSAAQVAQRLPYKALIAGLREAFAQDIQTPLRSMYSIDLATRSQATFGVMPAWRAGEGGSSPAPSWIWLAATHQTAVNVMMRRCGAAGFTSIRSRAPERKLAIY